MVMRAAVAAAAIDEATARFPSLPRILLTPRGKPRHKSAPMNSRQGRTSSCFRPLEGLISA